MSPPRAALEAATSRRMERREGFLNPRTIAREVVCVLTRVGREVRPAYVRRLVVRFVNDGYTTLREVEPFVLSYADPTGETAVRNVMRSPR